MASKQRPRLWGEEGKGLRLFANLYLGGKKGAVRRRRERPTKSQGGARARAHGPPLALFLLKERARLKRRAFRCVAVSRDAVAGSFESGAKERVNGLLLSWAGGPLPSAPSGLLSVDSRAFSSAFSLSNERAFFETSPSVDGEGRIRA